MNGRAGTDAEGFIQQLSGRTVQTEFKSIVDDVCASLVGTLGEAVDSIYLYGSVATGTAKLRESDLDVTLLIAGSPESLETQINLLKMQLQERHPDVFKIDFDIGSVTEALATENILSWGYWLKHHCRCVWGKDAAATLPRFKPSRSIAIALNGDFASVLRGYVERIDKAVDVVELRRLQREASRKAIRSTNILRAEHDQSWPLTLQDHADHFLRLEPRMRPEIEYLLEQAKTPTSPASQFGTALSSFTAYLLERHAKDMLPVRTGAQLGR